MSGLLPRTNDNTGSTSFTNVTTQNLTVNGVGYIASLIVGDLDFSDLTLNTLTCPVINGDPNINIVAGTASVGGDIITTQTSSVSLSNKTIDSGSNTLTVTNAPLSGVNVNSLINQDIRTSASPSFVTTTLSDQLLLNCGSFHPIIVNNVSNTSGSDILFQDNSVNAAGFGVNQTNDEAYAWSYSAIPFKIGTSNTERLRIPAAGIANDNALVNMLGLSGTTLSYKNNMVDTSSSQTLSNKTITACPGIVINTGGNTSLTWTGAGDLGYANVIGAWFSASAVGDFCLRQQSTARRLLLGVGSGVAQIQVSNTGTSFQTALTLASVANDNTAPQILARTAGNIVVHRTDMVDTSTAQVLTNKTLDSGSNTLTVTSTPISGVNVNSLLNQDVRTSATPTWNTINCSQIVGSPVIVNGVNVAALENSYNTNINQSLLTTSAPTFAGTSFQVGATLAYKTIPVASSMAVGVTTTMASIPIPTNSSVGIYLYLSSRCLNGTQNGYTTYVYDWKSVNQSGVVTTSNGSNQSRSDTAIAGAYNGKTTVAVAVSGTNVNVNIASTLASGNVFFGGIVEVAYS